MSLEVIFNAVEVWMNEAEQAVSQDNIKALTLEELNLKCNTRAL